jgi:hypothetical protein
MMEECHINNTRRMLRDGSQLFSNQTSNQKYGESELARLVAEFLNVSAARLEVPEVCLRSLLAHSICAVLERFTVSMAYEQTMKLEHIVLEDLDD